VTQFVRGERFASEIRIRMIAKKPFPGNEIVGLIIALSIEKYRIYKPVVVQRREVKRKGRNKAVSTVNPKQSSKTVEGVGESYRRQLYEIKERLEN
jgi:hypothetical protein